MTDLPFDPQEPDEPDDGDELDDLDELAMRGRRAVFVATAEPVPLTVAALDDPRAPQGTALGAYIEGRLVARCAMPRESIERLLALGLLEQPVPLGLVAFEADPGLQCRLLALVPAQSLEEGEEEEQEPWRASVPSFESRMAAEGGVDEEPGAEGEGNPSFAAILLGNIVRFDRDRQHRESLVDEAIDVLQRIVGGGSPLKDADARAIDDLLDSL